MIQRREITLVLVLTALFLNTACSREPASHAFVAELTVYAPGMHCEGCTATVEETLGKMDGVDSVYADLISKNVVIFSDTTKSSRVEIEHVLEVMGYLTPQDQP